MTFWSESFCAVCYRARVFAEAYQFVRRMKFRNYYIYAYELAEARAQLEIANATYRSLRKKEVFPHET